MSKLIEWNLMTLDGFFEGPKSWDLAFHQSAWGKELEDLSIEQLHTADALVFGRVTYAGMAAYWQTEQGVVADFMNNLPEYVFSRTLEKATWANSTLIKDNAPAEIAKLKSLGTGNILVFGSANLSETLLKHGLFDEIRICIVPVAIGAASPLFARNLTLKPMKLLETRLLSNGSVILRYQPQPA